MARIAMDDLTICHPCALVLANGPCDGCESCAFGDGSDCQDTAGQGQADRWGDRARGLTIDDSDNPHGENRADQDITCDGCGRTIPEGAFTHSAVIFEVPSA